MSAIAADQQATVSVTRWPFGSRECTGCTPVGTGSRKRGRMQCTCVRTEKPSLAPSSLNPTTRSLHCPPTKLSTAGSSRTPSLAQIQWPANPRWQQQQRSADGHRDMQCAPTKIRAGRNVVVGVVWCPYRLTYSNACPILNPNGLLSLTAAFGFNLRG